MTGIERITAERKRQIDVEGYAPEEDRYAADELCRAGAVYALNIKDRYRDIDGDTFFSLLWPWEYEYYKPTYHDHIRELEKAGALIAAAIDSLMLEQNGVEV